MFRINNKNFYIGEKVRIKTGRLSNAKGCIAGTIPENKTALIRIGTITHDVEFDHIESREPTREKLFIVLDVTDIMKVEYKCVITGVDKNAALDKIPAYKNNKSIEVFEINEVGDFDVVLVNNTKYIEDRE